MLESVCGLLSFFSFDTSGISSISEFLQIYCKRSVWQWEKKLPAMPIIVILWCGTWGHWELEIHARKKKKRAFLGFYVSFTIVFTYPTQAMAQ